MSIGILFSGVVMDFLHTDQLLENLYDGVYYVDRERQILYWNKAAERIAGYAKAEMIGKFCYNNILRHMDESGKQLCLAGCPLQATIQDGEMRENLVYLHHKDGHRVPVHVRVSPVRDTDGEIIGAVEIFNQFSPSSDPLEEIKKYKEEAYTDPLLEIGNRRYADMILNTRHYELQNAAVSYAIAFVDLDDFKQINDQYGHAVGDNVLRMIALSLKSATRQPDTIIRWGGDEFLVILPNVNENSIKTICERIKLFIKRSSLMVDEGELEVDASIGATVAHVEDTIESVIERADKLMYASKQSGKGKVTIG